MYNAQKQRWRRAMVVAICLIYYYYETYVRKIRCISSNSSGDKWIGKLLGGHTRRFHNMFRMSQVVFLDLLQVLHTSHDLHGSSRTTPREVLAITLYILSHNESIRATCERFQHSSETISRYFSVGLNALLSLSKNVIQPADPLFQGIPPEISHDPRYMPYFEDCIGVIDGTHVDARVPASEKVAYIGRSGSTTQNVMAVFDFNMCFTFVMAGWEGSAHDSHIFRIATQNHQYGFPKPPSGKYYLVDAGYPMERGFLKPFSKHAGRGRKKIFNKRHSSLHGVTQRSFGIWKKKWMILRNMPQYPFNKQVKIVGATMTLHNFIRRHPSRSDVEFDILDKDQTYVPPEAFEYKLGQSILKIDQNTQDPEVQDGEGAEEMMKLREKITDVLINE